MMRNISYSFETVNNKNIIAIYSSYLFYNNVINKKYNCNENNIYLYDVFLNYWCKENISEFFALLKITNYYYMMASSIKDKELYFNSEIENIMRNCDVLKTTPFVEKMVDLIDTKITQITSGDYENQMLKIVKDIIEFVSFGSKMCEGIEFVSTYYSKFLKRLFTKANPEIEKQILDVFSTKINPEIYTKMIFCLKDIDNGKIITNKIHSLDKSKIIFQSEKYKNIDTQSFDKNIGTYKLFRPYAFHTNNDIGNLDLPPQLSYFTDIFSSIFKKHDDKLKYKKFFTDYELSTTCFDLALKDTVYNFKANLLQTAILMTIIDNPDISAKKIAEKLKINQLKQISIPLNSLITIGLIVRPSGMAANNPNITFSFNSQWENNAENPLEIIDLVKQANLIKEKMEMMKKKQEINLNCKKMTSEEEAILKTSIIQYLSFVKEDTFENIMVNMKRTKEEVSDVIKKLQASSILEFSETSNKYSFVREESEDSEESECADSDKYKQSIVEYIKIVKSDNIDNICLNTNINKDNAEIALFELVHKDKLLLVDDTIYTLLEEQQEEKTQEEPQQEKNTFNQIGLKAEVKKYVCETKKFTKDEIFSKLCPIKNSLFEVKIIKILKYLIDNDMLIEENNLYSYVENPEYDIIE
jgi:hypothetical protein